MDAKPGRQRERRELELTWHRALSQSLADRSIDLPPFHVCTRQAYMPAFRRGLDSAERVVAAFAPRGRELSRVDAERARVVVCGVLVGWLDRSGIPLSARTLFQNFGNLAAAVDRAFPGYLAAGMLGVLLRRGS